VLYKKNIDSLMEVDPLLVAQLLTIETNKRFEVFVDEKDSANINIYDKSIDKPLYKEVAIDETRRFFRKYSSKYSRYPVVFFYGLGNGLFYRMLLDFKTVFKCVVIEPNLELIYIAFNLFDFSEDIEKKRFIILWEEIVSFHTINGILKDPDVKAFLKIYELQVLSNYYMINFKENVLRINKNFTEQIKNIIVGEGNDAVDSLIGLDHHLQNIPKMVKSYKLTDFLKNKNTKYAVIVSTGPSLAKQLPLLKEYSDYITIICIDASLPILQKERIKPDIVISLERVEATAKFFENLDREFLKDTIFLPTSISHPKLLKNLEGMRQSIYMRKFGYTSMFYLYKWGYLGIGLSAANAAFDFVIATEFENVAFIGQDLAFAKDGKTHSKGAIYGEREKQYKAYAEIDGYYGGKVETSYLWFHFLYGFKNNMQEAYSRGVKVYNCTEGGAYIDGAKHIPFKEFLGKVDKSKKKEIISLERVPESRSLHYIKRSKKLIKLYLDSLNKTKKRVEEVFLDVMANIEEIEKYNKDKELERIDFDKLARLISKIDKIKDIYEEDKVLRKFNTITNPYILHAELELARVMVQNTETEYEKKAKMIDWIYKHKNWLFFLAGAMDNIITVMQKNYDEIYAKY